MHVTSKYDSDPYARDLFKPDTYKKIAAVVGLIFLIGSLLLGSYAYITYASIGLHLKTWLIIAGSGSSLIASVVSLALILYPSQEEATVNDFRLPNPMKQRTSNEFSSFIPTVTRLSPKTIASNTEINSFATSFVMENEGELKGNIADKLKGNTQEKINAIIAEINIEFTYNNEKNGFDDLIRYLIKNHWIALSTACEKAGEPLVKKVISLIEPNERKNSLKELEFILNQDSPLYKSLKESIPKEVFIDETEEY